MPTAAPDLVRPTTSGPVRGRRRGDVLTWRGVPYAAAPVGERRFRAPAPPPPWAHVREADRFGPVAPQWSPGPAGSSPGPDEDCLTLNVTAPAVASADGPAPVLVWLHGGAYSLGSSAQSFYTHPSLVLRGGVVLVTVNYRLGALGYLDLTRFSTPEHPLESNLGLRDQVAALRWVHDNVAAFGGDPARVTVFGESAGGNAVTTLLATPAARGLLTAAIAQSSAPTNVLEPAHGAYFAGWFARLLGEDPDDVAAVSRRLRTASPAELVRATSTLTSRAPDEMPNTRALAPVVDGDYLPHHPLDAAERGLAAPVPLLLGTNAREGALFRKLPGLDILASTEPRVERMFARTDPGARERVLAAYPGYPGGRALADLGGDAAFGHPTLQLATAHARHAPVWLYSFDAPSRVLDLLGLGATHGTEVGLVMGAVGSPAERVFGLLGGRRARVDLSRRMQEHWLHLARHGEPLPGWPRYEPPTRSTMVFGAVDEVRDDPARVRREAWDGYRGWRGVDPPEPDRAQVRTVRTGPREVSRRVVVPAPASAVFDLVVDPHRHPELDGSGTVRDADVRGPHRLHPGARFSVGMAQRGLRYRITSTATAVEDDRLVEWQHPGGHRWRWEMQELTPGTTQVTETFAYATAKAPRMLELLRQPQQNGSGITRTLEALVERFS